MQSVVDFRPVETGATTLSALQAYQRIIREWAKHLNSYELNVALHIADRTIGWGKTRCAISANRIIAGDKVYGGLQISRATLFRTLASLEQKGMIARHPHPEGKEIKVYSVNLGWSAAMLNVPKRLKNPSNPSPIETTPSLWETTPVSIGATGEGNQGEGNLEKEDYSVSASPRPVPASVEMVRAAVSAASAATRSVRAAKAQTLPDKVAGVEAAFRAALEEAHPEAIHAAWSVREKAQVKAKIKTWIAKDGSMPEFVDWAVRNWAGIVAKQFKWMTRSPAPKVPEIGFLLSFMSQFIECRSEGKLDAWLASPERTEFEKLTGRGLSAEEAAAEIGKNRAVEVMRDENERVRIEARARHRRADIIERRTELTANLPAHPDSPAARRARGEEPAVPKIMSDEAPKIDWDNLPTLDPNWEPPQ